MLNYINSYFIIYNISWRLDVARGKKNWRQIFELFLTFFTPRPPMSVHKNISPIGPAVWLAIRNIYMNVLYYYLDTILYIEHLLERHVFRLYILFFF